MKHETKVIMTLMKLVKINEKKFQVKTVEHNFFHRCKRKQEIYFEFFYNYFLPKHNFDFDFPLIAYRSDFNAGVKSRQIVFCFYQNRICKKIVCRTFYKSVHSLNHYVQSER